MHLAMTRRANETATANETPAPAPTLRHLTATATAIVTTAEFPLLVTQTAQVETAVSRHRPCKKRKTPPTLTKTRWPS